MSRIVLFGRQLGGCRLSCGIRRAATLVGLLAWCHTAALLAETLEVQSNFVAPGGIQVIPGNSDRTDWLALPAYIEDEPDFSEPVNYQGIQVAHDLSNFYFHFLFEESDEFGFRHNLYLDVDQDRETGFIGTGAGFLALGAEYLVQGGSVFRFIAPAQNEWGWDWVTDTVWDATNPLAIEMSIPRGTFGDLAAFDFLLNASNFDLGLPEDFYPDSSATPDGGVFTYEPLDPVDIDELSAAIRNGVFNSRFDLNQDGAINARDREFWVHELRGTYFGDANLSGTFDSSDLVVVFQAGEYEDSVSGNSSWATGDWNGDADFSSGDLVIAFQDGGFEAGPRGVAAVPEPTAFAGCLLWLAVGARQFLGRRRRCQ